MLIKFKQNIVNHSMVFNSSQNNYTRLFNDYSLFNNDIPASNISQSSCNDFLINTNKQNKKKKTLKKRLRNSVSYVFSEISLILF